MGAILAIFAILFFLVWTAGFFVLGMAVGLDIKAEKLRQAGWKVERESEQADG